MFKWLPIVVSKVFFQIATPSSFRLSLFLAEAAVEGKNK
jgi:hypothetical protein